MLLVGKPEGKRPLGRQEHTLVAKCIHAPTIVIPTTVSLFTFLLCATDFGCYILHGNLVLFAW
jgi:hypothetical protein